MRKNKFTPGLYCTGDSELRWMIFKIHHRGHGIIDGEGYCFYSKKWLNTWSFQNFMKVKYERV